MKKLIILVPIIMLLALPVFAIELQVGALAEGVTIPLGSLDARVKVGPVTGEVAVGFTSFKFANPTVKIDDEEIPMPWDNLELRAHAAMIQAGVFLNWWEPPRMVVYSGVRGGLGLLGADFNMRTEWGEGYFDDTTVDLNGTLAAEHAGEHGNALFCKGVGRVSPAAPT